MCCGSRAAATATRAQRGLTSGSSMPAAWASHCCSASHRSTSAPSWYGPSLSLLYAACSHPPVHLTFCPCMSCHDGGTWHHCLTCVQAPAACKAPCKLVITLSRTASSGAAANGSSSCCQRHACLAGEHWHSAAGLPDGCRRADRRLRRHHR